ncbi:hypothetical protein [Streptomyces xantholiticus]|uniref:hypothetical protein n=1 Tax=Streptomyces xantholiticus TaxID=68285 RepID=UPI001676E95D|nr:hypothetical protein [Streptomyces xantholiticus]
MGRSESMITALRRPSAFPTALNGGEAAGRGHIQRKRRDFVYFYPIYTGTPIPMDDWRNRMWLDTWV